eukprot:GHRR01011165.1.p2 GENE.GHRR01011165.1~~GHRR01011165.1.p2  ORF type:complete len:112 (+),score=29.81 GHRR01011165.1:1146-1481(+)
MGVLTQLGVDISGRIPCQVKAGQFNEVCISQGVQFGVCDSPEDEQRLCYCAMPTCFCRQDSVVCISSFCCAGSLRLQVACCSYIVIQQLQQCQLSGKWIETLLAALCCQPI